MIAEAFASLLPIRAGAARPDALDDFWYRPVGTVSSSGITIRPDTALGISTVFACVRLLSETIASLPWRVYERTEDGKQEAPGHRLWSVLHDRPNRWQTAMDWREMAVAHLLLRGNFYCRVIEGGEQLVPLSPDHVQVAQNPDGRLVYTYHRAGGAPEYLVADDVFHVRGLSLDGIKGVSPIEFARNACGLAIAQESHGAGMFKNGGLPTFWISRPAGKPWKKEAVENFRHEWRKLHAGAENAGNPPILADGMELHELGLTNEDSQWIESRGFQAVEICRFFRCPPHMIGILDRATFSNIEQQSIEFVQYTIRPWAVRMESAANEQLLSEGGRNNALDYARGTQGDYFTKIVLEGLLRGDVKSRYEAYNVGLQAGFLTRNEVRALEDLNPIEGGDTPLEPLNMVGAGSRDQQTGEEPLPKERRPATPEEEQPDEQPRGKNSRRNRAVSESLDPMIQDAAARIGAAEIRGLEPRMDHAARNRPRWNAWVADYYAKHAEYTAKCIAPLALVACSLGGDGPEDETHLDHEALAHELCRQRADALIGSADPAATIAAWRETIVEITASRLKGAIDAALPKPLG